MLSHFEMGMSRERPAEVDQGTLRVWEPKRILSPCQSLMASCHCRLSSEVQPRLMKRRRSNTNASEHRHLIALASAFEYLLSFADRYNLASKPTQAELAAGGSHELPNRQTRPILPIAQNPN